MSNRREFLKRAALASAAFGFTNCGGSHTTPPPPTVPPVTPPRVLGGPYSQSPVLRKFISPLPGLGANGIPVATPDVTTYPGSDYYRLAAVQFERQMHPDLPNPTRLWGYQDLATGRPAYLGPMIVAQRNREVILRVQNQLPNKHLLPTDSSLMGDESGAALNRITVHLHGGYVPWTMDGNPFSWFTPQGAPGATNGSAGECFLNGVPGLSGVAEYRYPNLQSARLMWYHDHALGITRLNAYAGLAAGYLLVDPVMSSLTSGNAPLIPALNYTIPLILQDKTFKKVDDDWGRVGDLWYPSWYESARWEINTPSDGFTPAGDPPKPSCVPEFFGDTPVVNGEAYPYLEVEPRRYRFILLNGSQARFFNLNLFYESALNPTEADFTKAGPAFIQFANEGGLLPSPVVLNNPPALMPMASDGSVDPNGPKNLLLAPAERAELIIDFSACQPGDRLILHNDAPAPFPGGDPLDDYYTGDPDQTTAGGAAPTAAEHGPNTHTLMQIRVVARQGAADPYDFSSTISALQSQLQDAYEESHTPYGENDLDPEAPGVVFKAKTLNEDFDAYGRLVQRLGSDEKLYSDSYARNYDDDPTEVVNRDEVQVWDIYNTTGDTHPMHFHLVNVQVVGRAQFDASNPSSIVFAPTSSFDPPDPNERGWKETVRMNPGTVTRVIMKFSLPNVPGVPVSPRLASEYGMNGFEYVWHCHILEHEEHDMMRPLVVI